MYMKLHKSYRTVVAICDSGLVGKKFIEGEKQLDVRESFYKGEEIEHDEAVETMAFQAKEDATFNIVGEESVKAAIEAGVIAEEGVGKIRGIPYALVLL
jgi:uncharacterized protein